MTLGCGGYGGNITSDNISPRHLLNIKRLAYEVSPVVSRWDRPGDGSPQGAEISVPLPSAPARPAPLPGISADALSRRIDAFLSSRGFKAESGTEPPTQAPLDFVCEEDVRLAIQAGRKLVVSERAIVTPAARDLGEQHRVFTVAPWRG
jgi:hypothetical protein